MKHEELLEIIDRLLDETRGDTGDAAALLETICRQNMSVWAAVTDKRLYDACRAMVSDRVRKERRALREAMQHDWRERAARDGESLEQFAHMSRLWRYRIVGGIELRYATADKLKESVEFNRKQARTMLHDADFQERLSAELEGFPEGTTVWDALQGDSARLEELYFNTERA